MPSYSVEVYHKLSSMRCCINTRVLFFFFFFHLLSLEIQIITDDTSEIYTLRNLINWPIVWPYREQRIKTINYGKCLPSLLMVGTWGLLGSIAQGL